MSKICLFRLLFNYKKILEKGQVFPYKDYIKRFCGFSKRKENILNIFLKINLLKNNQQNFEPSQTMKIKIISKLRKYF